jgi:hypothetical protein
MAGSGRSRTVCLRSVEAFAATAQAEIDAGAVDRRDGTIILSAVRRWHSDQVWDLWR